MKFAIEVKNGNDWDLLHSKGEVMTFYDEQTAEAEIIELNKGYAKAEDCRVVPYNGD